MRRECRPTLWNSLQVVAAQGKPESFVWFAMKLRIISVTVPLGSIRHLQVQNLKSNREFFFNTTYTPSYVAGDNTPLNWSDRHLSRILILIPLPHFLTSSQGRSEDWLQVKSPTLPLASAPAAIPGSCRLSPPPGICCYDCGCEMLQRHRVALWIKEMDHG